MRASRRYSKIPGTPPAGQECNVRYPPRTPFRCTTELLSSRPVTISGSWAFFSSTRTTASLSPGPWPFSCRSPAPRQAGGQTAPLPHPPAPDPQKKRLASRPLGVEEGKGAVVLHSAHHIHGLLEILLGLPGKPTIMSVVRAISGIARRMSSTRHRYCSLSYSGSCALKSGCFPTAEEGADAGRSCRRQPWSR